MSDSTLQARLRTRTRFAMALTTVTIVIYFAFILVVTVGRRGASTLVAPGLSVALLLAASLIVCAWLLTVVYVSRTNRRNDSAIEPHRR